MQNELIQSTATVFQYLKVGYKEDGVFVYTRSPMERTSVNSYKLHRERFHLDIRKKFFTMRIIIVWNNLPRDMAESSSLEVFKM